jgi:hypothetical protein
MWYDPLETELKEPWQYIIINCSSCRSLSRMSLKKRPLNTLCNNISWKFLKCQGKLGWLLHRDGWRQWHTSCLAPALFLSLCELKINSRQHPLWLVTWEVHNEGEFTFCCLATRLWKGLEVLLLLDFLELVDWIKPWSSLFWHTYIWHFWSCCHSKLVCREGISPFLYFPVHIVFYRV